ncbi:MAG TPA: glycerate kinase [Clostridia bacterium]|nr:glycerate kinase [Clostridia bacterium]
MPRFILVPDSYKGTMTSTQVCEAMERGIRRVMPEAIVDSLPVADGGEGSVDAFIGAIGGKKRAVEVCGPFFDKVEAYYGILEDGQTAVIEMAACAGLPLVFNKKDPSRTTTYGAGELMLHAAHSGCRQIIMCLGGSATNDGGCGAAAAAGIRFYDKNGRQFIPVGGTLSDIVFIDASGVAPALAGVSIITMCDVDNPLYGESGAAHVFAPQKGADGSMVRMLDEGLRALARATKSDDIARMAGSGAAGGMGFGMRVFFSSKLRMGIETVLDITGFDELLSGTDYVFTGEGRIDPQSMHGKVVVGVARRAKRAGVPVIAVVGDISDGVEEAYDMGVTAIFSINRVALEREAARKRAPRDLEMTVSDIARILRQ